MSIEEKFRFKFPPDLKLLLQTALPVSDGFMPWRSYHEAGEWFSFPLQGMLFDVQYNSFWNEEWGESLQI